MQLIKKTFYIFAFALIILSCSKKTNHIEIDISKDECFFFINDKADTLKFERYLKILENTLSDSIMFGMSVLAPKQIGIIEYNKFEDREDILVDLRYTNPFADRICVGLYKEKEPKGILKIELTYQKKESE